MQWAGFAGYCAVFSSIYGRHQIPQCSSLAWFLTCPLLCGSRRYRILWCSRSCSFWFCPSYCTRLLTCPLCDRAENCGGSAVTALCVCPVLGQDCSHARCCGRQVRGEAVQKTGLSAGAARCQVVDVPVVQVDGEMSSTWTRLLTCPLVCNFLCLSADNCGVPAVAVHRWT